MQFYLRAQSLEQFRLIHDVIVPTLSMIHDVFLFVDVFFDALCVIIAMAMAF